MGRWVDLPAIAWRERAAPGRFVEEHAMGSAGKLTRERDGGRAVRFRGDVLLKCLTDRSVESGSRLAGARFRTREYRQQSDGLRNGRRPVSQGLFKRRQFQFSVLCTLPVVVSSPDESARQIPVAPVAPCRGPACPMCAARRSVRTLEGFRTDTFFCPSCEHVWEVRKPRTPAE